MKKKIVVVSGVGGQDASYLCELLLEKDYQVYGMMRRSSNPNLENVKHLLPHVEIVQGDLCDATSLNLLIRQVRPQEVYNLGAQSHVHTSFQQPSYTMDVNGLGCLRLLEAIRTFAPAARFYQASTSEMWAGLPDSAPQNEQTPLFPRSPYGISKVYAHHITRIYRESYNIFATSGILLNHESPRRGSEFVTRKITKYVAELYRYLQNLPNVAPQMPPFPTLKLGNLEAKRDWGFAGDFVRGMYLILQYPTPEDFVLATGETHTVKEFLEVAFAHVGLDYQNYIEIDPQFYRPNEVHVLQGDASKAKKLLGWEPRVTFHELVTMMVDADLAALS
jgi:GDPmannose 4,6-dehydratase